MTTDTLQKIKRDTLYTLRPPAKLNLADWVEKNIYLPSSIAAAPGRMRLWPHQRGMAESIGDPAVERVSILKSARIGYTQLLIAAIGHYVENDPGPILVVVPTEADARNLMVNGIEPTFGESPLLRVALSSDEGGRDTLMQRRFPGGSLKLVSARAPRNLRAHTARILLLDEVDGFEIDVRGEGDPVALAEKRTLSYGDRKIVIGSTPVDEATSRILRAYETSDRRVYECPCPDCGEFHEIMWKDIRWDSGKPDTAHWACPSCGVIVEEVRKAQMVQNGRWHITRPDVEGHHGYKINALVSLLPNAAWSKLVAEFLEAKRSPETLKAFTTTLLAEPWRDDAEQLDQDALFSRREPFSLESIPSEVLVITAGCDVQDDRIEITTTGWTKEGDALVLAHEIVFGSPLQDETWLEVDDLLRRHWKHPLGGIIRYDAAIVDSGSGGHTDAVYTFCGPRNGRRIMAGKGVAGFQRPSTALSTSRRARLILVGVDAVKSQIFNRLEAGGSIRFSDTLDANWFEQLTAERITTRYRHGHPVRAFEKISGRRNEALDTLTYSFAARQLVNLDLSRRNQQLNTGNATSARTTVVKSGWLEGI
ncbi:MAG: terminase [Marinosulfonomonas sp.]|nr:MAG: terminase [Marinosulfonomonas sp.]